MQKIDSVIINEVNYTIGELRNISSNQIAILSDVRIIKDSVNIFIKLIPEEYLEKNPSNNPAYTCYYNRIAERIKGKVDSFKEVLYVSYVNQPYTIFYKLEGE